MTEQVLVAFDGETLERDAGRFEVLVSNLGPQGLPGADGDPGAPGPPGPAGPGGNGNLVMAVVNGAPLGDADVTLDVSMGRLFKLGATLTQSRTIHLSTRYARYPDGFEFRVDVPQAYDLLFVNDGPGGNSNDPLAWMIPAGWRMLMIYRFNRIYLPGEFGNWEPWERWPLVVIP